MSASQKFFRYLFGQEGDRAAVSDTTAADGAVSYQVGYGFDYQRAGTDPLKKNIERDKQNQVLYDVTLGLRQYQTRGFPEFVAAADNGGAAFPYAKNAYVLWTDGNVYYSLVAANTSTPADLTKWQPLASGVGQIAYFPGTAAPLGYVKANGAVLSRAAYPLLWAYAQTSGNLAASDAEWQSGQFSPGDGATTFRVPDDRGYVARAWDDGRGVDAGRAIGSVQGDQFPAHSHVLTINAAAAHSHTAATGAAGGHDHGAITAANGGHTHTASGAAAGGHTHDAATVSAGAHSHTVDLVRGVLQSNASNNTNEGVYGTGTTSTAGAHVHDVTVTAAPTHTHGVTVDPAATHTHGITAAPTHTHTISADGGHAHAATAADTGTGTEVRVKSLARLACIRYL